MFVATHDANVALFQVGQPTPAYIPRFAEDGVLDDLVAAAQGSPDVYAVTTGNGLTKPGQSASFTIESSTDFPLITVATMLATTNDAVAAVLSVPLPTGTAAEVHEGVVYDAGSEANTESCKTIPGPPCGNLNVRDTEGAEGFVSVHNGIHGIGDLAPATYDWRNPAIVVSVRKLQ
jgi:hypothetical protein